MQTLEEIGEPDRVEACVREAFAQKRKIMGFGHAVYRPRTRGPRTCGGSRGSSGEETGDAPLVRRCPSAWRRS